MTLSDRLKLVRKTAKKSQKEMAVAAGVSTTAWQNYESGDQFPGGKVFEALARMGFDSNWLLMGVGEMKRGDAPIMVDPGVQYTSGKETKTQLHEELLQAVLEAVEDYLDSIDGHLPPAKKAQLVAMLYEMCAVSAENNVDKATVIRLVKLAA